MPRLLFAASALALVAADWPQLFGPTRDGHSAETKLDWNWPKGGPAVAWKFDAGSGWAGPVAVGERVYLFHRVENDEVLQCLEAATGKPVWKESYRTRYRDDFQFDDGPRSTPTIADNRIVTLGANGDLHAWELPTGKKLWHRNLIADYKVPKGYFGVACSPLVVNGKILVNVGGKGAGVVAFDPANGNELWKASDDAASHSSPVAADIGGQTLAVFLTRRGLLALDPANGTVKYSHDWRPRIDASVNAASPLVWNGDIFLSVSYSTGGILLRPKGGELDEVWSNDKSLSCHYNTPVRVGEYLYGIHGRQDGGAAQLRCVEWKTGAVKWSQERFGVAWLIAVDGGLLALTEAGELIRFDASPDGFKERGRASILKTPTRAAPGLAGGRLFARDGEKLVCVKLR